MLLFVDTEFADTRASELVSLALVSEDGKFEFYAERDPLPHSPTAFVSSVVYPLLDRGSVALSDREFARQLHAFFDRVKAESKSTNVLVAYDYAGDVHLLDYALDGFRSPRKRTPLVFDAVNLNSLGEVFAANCERIFKTNAEARARRHHALIDARVNRDAYLAVSKTLTGRAVNEIETFLKTGEDGPAC